MNKRAQVCDMLPARQRGMALIIVLWLIVLLGVIAAGHASNVHSETRLAMQHVESAKARTLAEAGIQRAIVSLLLRNGGPVWPVNGTPQRLVIDEREVTVAVRDATGLIDLNAADAGLLGALIATTGDDLSQQEKLVDAILDWRDSDNLTHLHGAEDDAYRAAGLAWTARDAAFSSVDELRYVFGMTAERFAAVVPYVTVHSGRAALNLEYAPPFLIAAVTGQTLANNEYDDGLTPQERQPRAASIGRNGTYHIYASATGNGKVTASVEAVVRIASTAEQAYSVLYWREPGQFPSPAPDRDST
jgi:general secretion pathway protein K